MPSPLTPPRPDPSLSKTLVEPSPSEPWDTRHLPLLQQELASRPEPPELQPKCSPSAAQAQPKRSSSAAQAQLKCSLWAGRARGGALCANPPGPTGRGPQGTLSALEQQDLSSVLSCDEVLGTPGSVYPLTSWTHPRDRKARRCFFWSGAAPVGSCPVAVVTGLPRLLEWLMLYLLQ